MASDPPFRARDWTKHRSWPGESGRQDRGCEYVRADLTKVSDRRNVNAEADRRLGLVGVLVAAAALTDRGDIFDATEERFDEIFDVKVPAPFSLIQGPARVMCREVVARAIVNIQSRSAHGGQPFIAAHCASKGALATLTRNIGHSLVKFRMGVNGLNIVWMSALGEDRIMKTDRGAKDGWLEAAARTKPFGRLPDPKDVARACVYLGSDGSGLMTGADIDFDQNVVGAAGAPIRP
jgi:NAD(P)-dependent dehydrogenase (short-subunit alcohol dehydrogenase family)